ncbi:deoxyguanosinetriphosphate triphosphohydrolase [bacterium AH-315-P07]|nr:deoxyguanosinetriphosphate triphosphohydrolase [bacterium AH-315-P07]
MTSIREKIEEQEKVVLSSAAAFASETKGRAEAEDEHEYRTAYQRDRDRILHTKSFRRLKGKTQVFLAPKGDHYRTRLTHTLEVAQISRTVARALFLNEDLTEAIALGHDLGHTPFGHAGESVLNEIASHGFRHYEQSLRVVDVLESTTSRQGLNLTYEVRDGIAKHSTGKVILLGRQGDVAETLEGRVLSVCDAIAYINHDIDDAIRANVIKREDLPCEAVALLGESASKRINTMVGGLIRGSVDGAISMEDDIRDATNALRDYLYTKVYPGPMISQEVEKAKRVIHELYAHITAQPDSFIEYHPTDDSIETKVIDTIAGMTDQYALELYQKLFFPDSYSS